MLLSMAKAANGELSLWCVLLHAPFAPKATKLKTRKCQKRDACNLAPVSLSFTPELALFALVVKIFSIVLFVLHHPHPIFFPTLLSYLTRILRIFSDDEINRTRFLDVERKRNDDNYSCYGSECSYCSCGYCDDENCRINGNYSICERWVKKTWKLKKLWTNVEKNV